MLISVISFFSILLHVLCAKKKNSVAFSPQANYTDCATATCRRKLVPTFADRGVSRGHHGGSPTIVNLSLLDRSRYFSFKYLFIYRNVFQCLRKSSGSGLEN
jgi:hypothetical protein